MKTIAIWVLFLSAGLTLRAQDETANLFRPSKNNFSVEVNFKPFSADAPISIDGFRGRLFLGNKLAIRLGCNFAVTKNYQEFPVEYINTTYYSSTDERYTVLGVTPGIEYHFLNSQRFSPYVGIVLGYENKTSKAVYTDAQYVTNDIRMVTTDIKNAWSNSGSQSNFYQRGYSKISASVVLGADFYLMKHLYMGVELGVAYNALIYKEIVVNVDGSLNEKVPQAKEYNSGLTVNNAIRLGFWF